MKQKVFATIFPASQLPAVRRFSALGNSRKTDELFFVTGSEPLTVHRVMLVAEEFVRSGRPVRVIQRV